MNHGYLGSNTTRNSHGLPNFSSLFYCWRHRTWLLYSGQAQPSTSGVNSATPKLLPFLQNGDPSGFLNIWHLLRLWCCVVSGGYETSRVQFEPRQSLLLSLNPWLPIPKPSDTLWIDLHEPIHSAPLRFRPVNNVWARLGSSLLGVCVSARVVFGVFYRSGLDIDFMYYVNGTKEWGSNHCYCVSALDDGYQFNPAFEDRSGSTHSQSIVIVFWGIKHQAYSPFLHLYCSLYRGHQGLRWQQATTRKPMFRTLRYMYLLGDFMNTSNSGFISTFFSNAVATKSISISGTAKYSRSPWSKS